MNTLSNLSVGVAPWLPPILFAPFIGSFLGLLIVRLPDGRPVLLARSACDRCGHTLAARDMVPFVSYLWCRGRCRYCGAAIGTFPFAVELAALTVVLWAVVSVADAELWWACLLGWTLLTLGWIDVRTMLLPDVLTLPLLAAGLVEAAIAEPDVLADHALAAVFGYLSLFAVAWFWRRQIAGRDRSLARSGGVAVRVVAGGLLGPRRRRLRDCRGTENNRHDRDPVRAVSGPRGMAAVALRRPGQRLAGEQRRWRLAFGWLIDRPCAGADEKSRLSISGFSRANAAEPRQDPPDRSAAAPSTSAPARRENSPWRNPSRLPSRGSSR